MPAHLEVLALHDAQARSLLGRQFRRSAQAQVLRAGQPLVALPLGDAMLAGPHAVHGPVRSAGFFAGLMGHFGISVA